MSKPKHKFKMLIPAEDDRSLQDLLLMVRTVGVDVFERLPYSHSTRITLVRKFKDIYTSDDLGPNNTITLINNLCYHLLEEGWYAEHFFTYTDLPHYKGEGFDKGMFKELFTLTRKHYPNVSKAHLVACYLYLKRYHLPKCTNEFLVWAEDQIEGRVGFKVSGATKTGSTLLSYLILSAVWEYPLSKILGTLDHLEYKIPRRTPRVKSRDVFV